MYASNVMLCPSGERHEPMYSHLKSMQKILAQVAGTLMALPPATPWKIFDVEDGTSWKNGTEQRAFVYSDGVHEIVFIENDANATVGARFTVEDANYSIKLWPLSVLVLLDQKEVFDSSVVDPRFNRRTTTKVLQGLKHEGIWPLNIVLRDNDDEQNVTTTPRPLEQTKLMFQSANISSDFAVYQTEVTLHDDDVLYHELQVATQTANAFTLFIDGAYIGSALNHEHKEENVTLSISIDPQLNHGRHTITLLSESLGYFNEIGRWGSGTRRKTKGITGSVRLLSNGGESYDLAEAASNRRWLSLAGLPSSSSTTDGVTTSRIPPCSWSNFRFATPTETTRKLFLWITSGRGKLWLNGHDLGRFWNITAGSTNNFTQRYYHLPYDFLHRDGVNKINLLCLFHASESDVSKIKLVEAKAVEQGADSDFLEGYACLQ